MIHYSLIQGRRASLRSALAPGYHIPRLRRCIASGTERELYERRMVQ